MVRGPVKGGIDIWRLGSSPTTGVSGSTPSGANVELSVTAQTRTKCVTGSCACYIV